MRLHASQVEGLPQGQAHGLSTGQRRTGAKGICNTRSTIETRVDHKPPLPQHSPSRDDVQWVPIFSWQAKGIMRNPETNPETNLPQPDGWSGAYGNVCGLFVCPDVISLEYAHQTHV